MSNSLAAVRLIHVPTGRIVAGKVRRLPGFWQQLRGVIGSEPENGEAAALPGCPQIHTAFLRRPIDAAFCDGAGVVLCVCSLAPWRVSPYVRGATIVYEGEAGCLNGIEVGDRLRLE